MFLIILERANLKIQFISETKFNNNVFKVEFFFFCRFGITQLYSFCLPRIWVLETLRRVLVACTLSPILSGKQLLVKLYTSFRTDFKCQYFCRTSVMLTVVSVIVGVCSVSIITMWIYDMKSSGVNISWSAAQSEVWFLTLVYELTVKGVLSEMWATLVYALVFLSGFLSLVSIEYT